MLWFTVWTTLIVLTLAGAALLGVRLWRSGKALLAQLKESTEVLNQLEARIAELEAVQERETAHVPAVLATAEDRAQWHAVRRQNRDLRAQRRAVRMDSALERWRRAGLPL